MPRSAFANTIALHDFTRGEPDLKGWFEYVFAFFEKYGVIPTKGEVLGVNGTSLRNTVLFRTVRRNLEKNHFKGVEAIVVNANPNFPEHRHDTFDVIFTADFTCNSLKNGVTLCFDDLVVPWNSKLFKTLARDLSCFFGAQYGYAYQRPWVHGPWAYPYGTEAQSGRKNPVSEEESWRIAQWGIKFNLSSKKYKTGDLRDIYPMNVLCDAHLKRVLSFEIGSATLEEWIRANPIHGSLEALSDTEPALTAWFVEPENIEAVRAALLPTGIILCL